MEEVCKHQDPPYVWLFNQTKEAGTNMTKNLTVTKAKHQCSVVQMGAASRKSSVANAYHMSGLSDTMARRMALLTKRHMKVCFNFAKKNPTY